MSSEVTGTFTIDRDTLGKQSAEIMSRKLQSVLRQIVNEAKVRSPVRTGELKRSIKADPVTATGPFTVEGSVTAETEYAAAVHEGTDPHVIRAKNVRALKFDVGGKTVFRRSVNHPGTRPRPFLRNAAEQVARNL